MNPSNGRDFKTHILTRQHLLRGAEFGGHGQLRGGKGRGKPATGKLVAWQTKIEKSGKLVARVPAELYRGVWLKGYD